MEDLFYYQDLYEPIEGDMTNPKEKSKKGWKKINRKTIRFICHEQMIARFIILQVRLEFIHFEKVGELVRANDFSKLRIVNQEACEFMTLKGEQLLSI